MSIVDERWGNFWKERVTDENGNIDVEQVKKELSDFKHLIDNVPKVYDRVTDSRLSKVMYDAETVIDAFKEFMADERDFWYQEGVKDTENQMYSNL